MGLEYVGGVCQTFDRVLRSEKWMMRYEPRNRRKYRWQWEWGRGWGIRGIKETENGRKESSRWETKTAKGKIYKEEERYAREEKKNGQKRRNRVRSEDSLGIGYMDGCGCGWLVIVQTGTKRVDNIPL